MLPVLTVAEMNAVDARARDTVALDVLVGRAGHAVAVVALDLMGGAYGRRVVVIAGRGNNGADGRVAGSVLARRGAAVTVVEAAAAPAAITGADLVIDAAYGTGFRGEYTAPSVDPGTPVLAVDIPSGVVGDTGAASGSPLTATATVTFVALKPGLVQGAGVQLSGDVRVIDIGLDPGPSTISVLDDGDIDALLPERSVDGNKWSAGVLVVAGSPGMTGAAGLCARSAYRTGAGMVRLGVPGGELAASPATEAVSVALPAQGWATEVLAAAERCGVVVIGPGLGREPSVAAEVRRVVDQSPVPVVVDADGLYALGRVDADGVRSAPSTVVMTPHDGEFRRLAGADPGPDRIAAARSLAAGSGAVVLLKGPTTAVAEPTGRVLLGRSGTSQLATAGTGDVLSGMIGAMIARGTAPFEAAALAAHVHGRAAASGHTEGLVAGDLPELVASYLSDLRERAHPGPRAPAAGAGAW
jgi:NAD(P)H-hydrate epimerase